MKITNIQIKNFRNYPSLNLDVTSDVVVISGPNAVGKTNLLESVYFASLFKSFRDDNEFIFLKDSNQIDIKIQTEKEGQLHTLQIFLERREKIYANFLLDGVKKKRKEAQNFISVVIFDPTDVDLFSKTPDARRKYFNMVLSQKSHAYLEVIGEYKRILFQKSRLLQDIKAGRAQVSGLDVWDEQLAEIGSQIIFERKQFVNFLNTSIAEIYSSISGFHRPVEVVYETLPGETVEEIKNEISLKLKNYRSKELLSASCLVGPHKDDFTLKSEGLLLPPFSSRGELRSQILSLKIS